MGQRNRDTANVGRQFAGKGVAGGVAAAAQTSAQNQADQMVNKSMQENQRINQNDLKSQVNRNQKITGEALSQGEDKGLAAEISTDSGQGLTVICTELHRQGALDDETIAADREFGIQLRETNMDAYLGYICWAKYVASWMRTSPFLTFLVSIVALPWAAHMSGKKNRFGALVMATGLIVCPVIGRIYKAWRNVYAY